MPSKIVTQIKEQAVKLAKEEAIARKVEREENGGKTLQPTPFRLSDVPPAPRRYTAIRAWAELAASYLDEAGWHAMTEAAEKAGDGAFSPTSWLERVFEGLELTDGKRIFP